MANEAHERSFSMATATLRTILGPEPVQGEGKAAQKSPRSTSIDARNDESGTVASLGEITNGSRIPLFESAGVPGLSNP